ncbi:MAG: SusC/RagA family TonB-linked outer membrane protein [Gemmatimonadota bacterium]
MKKRVVTVLMGFVLFAAQAFAQQKTVTGRVTNDQGTAIAGAQIVVKGTGRGTLSNAEGRYSTLADVGQVLQFSFVGTTLVERTVGSANVIDVELRTAAISLDALEVTALGQTTARRALGTSQQSVQGAAISQTQRENFVNALQGRVAGVEVVSSSGVPGASSSIVIRGVSSISSSNQPLMIVDGLPIDNKTLNTTVLGADYPGSAIAYSNRGLDFTNRAADINPEDIESLTVLKGPEASALYGIDAANGAIVITTKRGKPGVGGFEYSNSFRLESTNVRPEIQQTYGVSGVGGSAPNGTFFYFGAPFAPGTTLYNNVDGFFQTALTKKHNLSLSGAAADSRVSYRLSGSSTQQEGVVPNSKLDRINITGASRAQVTSWLNADVSMQYMHSVNDQPRNGAGGPLLGLLAWPSFDKASEYLTPAGTRRTLTTLAASAEIDNPYLSTNRNINNTRTNHMNVNVGLTLTPFSWGSLKTNIGTDNYTTQITINRDPFSALGFANSGILDVTDDITRHLNAQTVLNFNSRALTRSISISGLLGNAITENKSQYNGMVGMGFLDPNFVAINNTDPARRLARTTLSQRRLVSAFGQAVIDYRNYFYLTVTGRNDWTSTIPQERNSFFYPSVSTSFIFSDAFPAVRNFMTGKVRAAYAEVGKDARPYAFRPSLQSKTTTAGGYGYDFWGPNLNLRPEFARSHEFGTELSFLNNRLGVDATVYRKQTKDQIVENLRGSYATGFILFNLNGAETRNEGLELTLRGTPLLKRDFSWDFIANFAKARGKTLSLPHDLPESYVSDTWLYGNVRNGTKPGLSTMSLTGLFYLRNNKGELLIDPTTGLPLRSSAFIDGGYDRQPDFLIGITNTLRYKRLSLDFLVDIRKGGDVFNATEHFLTVRGLSMRTLDREQPRIIKGVLRDGKENTSNPTPNSIVVIPSVQSSYYTNMSEELFIEKDINWLRLRDVTVRYSLPERLVLNAKNASVFVTATDLYLLTNYSGLDPIVNGNSAAVGGSSGVGIDLGNFPVPRGINFGVKMGF